MISPLLKTVLFLMLALILAPLAPMFFMGSFLSLQKAVIEFTTVTNLIGRYINGVGLIVLLGSFFAYPTAFLIFLPQHLILRLFKLWGYHYYVLIGLSSGITLVLYLSEKSRRPLAENLTSSLGLILIGSSIVAALSFRFIVSYSLNTTNDDKRQNFKAKFFKVLKPMRKYLALTFFLIVPFAPLIAKWWHKRNGGVCSLDKPQHPPSPKSNKEA